MTTENPISFGQRLLQGRHTYLIVRHHRAGGPVWVKGGGRTLR
jgi:hypothetical protein